ncbi:TIGR03089 family protein [uncultured Jatrophihabitans sp.]|uniref:TIGR03089 family protein n=1 Tax=uncultured Jatrophihabitans sp. TaxID=1610747 RepID=UPI0035CACAEE
MHQLTPERRFAELVATEGSRPFVTYYNEATGERSELSVRSLANWVAKTHHLLTDELGLGVGSTALVALPAHWISVPILLGCLTAGLALTDEPDADVAFVSEHTAPDAAGVLDVYAVATASVAPMAAAQGFRGAEPADTQDYVVAVRPQGDAWAGVAMPAGPDDPCLPGLARGAAVDAAAARADELGLADGGRLLSTRDWTSPADWVDAVLTPLVVGGSLVIVRNAGDDVIDRRVQQERATALLR